MDKHAHSASALAESANKYTSMDDASTPIAAEMGEADEEIGESRVGMVDKKAWGFWKVVWFGGAVFVGTVIAALVFEWSSAVRSPDPHSVTQLELGFNTTGITDGGTLLLKSTLSATYLHVSSRTTSNGDPVFHTDSTTPGSKWQVVYVGGMNTTVMLKNLRSGFYLHVADEKKSSGDPVFQRESTSDGSKWQVEYVAPVGSMIRLKSVRSGFYLQATPRSERTCCDHVFQTDSVTDGSKWNMEAPSAASAPDSAPAASEPDGATKVQHKYIVWLNWKGAPNADLLKTRSKSRQFLTLAEARKEVTLKCSPDEVSEFLSEHGQVESKLLEGHWMVWTSTYNRTTLSSTIGPIPHNLSVCFNFSQVPEPVDVISSVASPPGYPENCNRSHWPGYDLPPNHHKEIPYLIGGQNTYPLNSETMEPWTTWRSLQKTYNITADAPSQKKKPVIGLIELWGRGKTRDFSMDDYECLRRATGAKESRIEIHTAPGVAAPTGHCFGFETCNSEAQLDVQVAATVNQNADIYYIDGTNVINIIEYFQEVHTGMKALPTVLSTSYSRYEGEDTNDFAIALCNEFYILATAGVPSFAATGDSGASGSGQFYGPRQPSNSFHVLWAAACPFVTAVGGSAPASPGCSDCETSAISQDFNINLGEQKLGCNPSINCITSSGGFSTLFTEANGYNLSFQAAAVGKYKATGGGLQGMEAYKKGQNMINSQEVYGRGLPDISLNSQNWMTFQSGQFTATSGTSASAPALAAIISLAYDGTPFGWINPFLYEKYQEGGYFWDITEGNNFWGENSLLSDAGYFCEAGWDPVTGVGSFGNSSAHGAQRFLDALRSQ